LGRNEVNVPGEYKGNIEYSAQMELLGFQDSIQHFNIRFEIGGCLMQDTNSPASNQEKNNVNK
jgi:hypothetical protein